MFHSYPQDLVNIFLDKWTAGESNNLPGPDVLNELVSTCYQTSIMSEEKRSLKFRLILVDPEKLAAEDGPPAGLLRLIFSEPRAFSQYELRKLAPAVDFYGSLIGIRVNSEGKLQIWGIVHSGQRWIQAIRGGSARYAPLPDSLVLYIIRAGQIVVCKGSEMVAMLSDGGIMTPSRSVLNSHWLRASIGDATAYLWDLHSDARSKAKKPWAFLERNFPILVSWQITKRIISIVRNSHHGGTIISLPLEKRWEACSRNDYLNIKYLFKEDEPRNRFRTLLLKIMNTLAESCGDAGQPDRIVGWKEYVASKNDVLRQLDEAVFEHAHFIAGLAAVDGAVILTQRHELLGFGGVILGPSDNVRIARALDSEGDHTMPESMDGVGMRHRAAYHLCNELQDAFAMIISQDGDVDVAKRKNGVVTCWNVLPYPHFTEDSADAAWQV